ncbi:MAG: N-acetyltransferase family protein [Bacillota bacterium]|nr:N-acetyltransferase family protein [Bacillota bacterium]
MKEIYITNFTIKDWEEIRAIYKEGIETGNSTLETEVPNWEDWGKNLIKECRLIAKNEDEILGWAAITRFSNRKVYYGVGDVSIYIKESARGKGIGKKLLDALVIESEKYGYWTLQSKIFPNNTASINLHLKCGFRKVGIRDKFGKRNDQPQDILLMERRSEVVK